MKKIFITVDRIIEEIHRGNKPLKKNSLSGIKSLGFHNQTNKNHQWITYHAKNNFLDLSLRVCVCTCTHTHGCMHIGRNEVSVNVFLNHSHFMIWTQPHWLASKSQGPLCLCLPIAGTARTIHRTCFSHGCWKRT